MRYVIKNVDTGLYTNWGHVQTDKIHKVKLWHRRKDAQNRIERCPWAYKGGRHEVVGVLITEAPANV